MKHTVRTRSHRSDYDLRGDLLRIKEAIADTGRDVKGRAGEVISQSLNDFTKKSNTVKKNVTGYVTGRPLKSLGVAVLVGMAMGYFINK